MDSVFQPGSLIVADWLRCAEGAEILRAISVNGKRLRPYGLLEQPILPASCHLDDVHYKIMVVGKVGVGKTSTVSHLSGRRPVPDMHSETAVSKLGTVSHLSGRRPVPDMHSETVGIQTTKIYWPVKIAHLNKKVLMNLTFWDTGEISGKKFDHILPLCILTNFALPVFLKRMECSKVPQENNRGSRQLISACKAGLDGIVYVFSFIDKSSWEELPHLIARYTDPGDRLAKVVIGTKFDQYAHSEVSQRELRDFENRWQTPVLRISNTPNSDAASGLADIIPVMNCLCERLWQRDVLKEERK